MKRPQSHDPRSSGEPPSPMDHGRAASSQLTGKLTVGQSVRGTEDDPSPQNLFLRHIRSANPAFEFVAHWETDLQRFDPVRHLSVKYATKETVKLIGYSRFIFAYFPIT